MNDSQLEELLRNQYELDGDYFTKRVMSNLPERHHQQFRAIFLVGAIFVGTILTLLLSPTQQLIFEYVTWELDRGIFGAAIAIGFMSIGLSLLVGLSVAAGEEIQ